MGSSGAVCALLVGGLVVVARGLYLARHLFTLYRRGNIDNTCSSSKVWHQIDCTFKKALLGWLFTPKTGLRKFCLQHIHRLNEWDSGERVWLHRNGTCYFFALIKSMKQLHSMQLLFFLLWEYVTLFEWMKPRGKKYVTATQVSR